MHSRIILLVMVLYILFLVHTPHENGLVKRKHHHIIETAITILTTASFPHKFWYHVVAHTIFLINQMPSKIIGTFSKVVSHFTKDFIFKSLWFCNLFLS